MHDELYTGRIFHVLVLSAVDVRESARPSLDVSTASGNHGLLRFSASHRTDATTKYLNLTHLFSKKFAEQQRR